jgi:hypothetical protein
VPSLAQAINAAPGKTDHARAPGKTCFCERRFGVSSVSKMAIQGIHIAYFYRKTHYEL